MEKLVMFLFVFAVGGLAGAASVILTYRRIVKDPVAARSFLTSLLIARPDLSLLACESCKQREIDTLINELPTIPLDRD